MLFYDCIAISCWWSILLLRLSVLLCLYCCCTTTIATKAAETSNTITCTASDQGGGQDGACQIDANDDTNHLRQLHLPPPDCKVYIAKSTIPNAGLGIFNGPIPKRTGDDTLAQHGGDVCIPIIDMIYHSYDKNDPYSTTSTSPFSHYYWGGFVMGFHPNSVLYEGSGVEAFCPGFDALINCHLGLTDLLYTSIPQYDDLSIPLHFSNHHQERYHRSTHPGSGAFTPYFNGTSKVKAKNAYIPPYSELFKEYGDHWFESRAHIFGNIPLSNDYHNIYALLQKFAQLRITRSAMSSSVQEHSANGSDINSTATDVAISLYEALLHRFKDIYDSRTLNALPSTFQDAIYIGNSSSKETLTQYLVKQHTTSLEHLQKYGTCIDQIRPGRSTLSNAGHGGFATRLFRKGTIITASPLLIIPDEQVLEMYDFTKYNHTWYRNYQKKKQYQLLYNYCYGHPSSTLLLCPHGGGINYINHNQSLVNVKMEWTTTQLAYIHNTALVMNGTLGDLTNLAYMQQGSQLVFQYVATRDIQPNEELYLDYGNEWEAAWQHHIHHYPYSNRNNDNDDGTNPPQSPEYISAHEFNYYHQDALIRTMDEQKVEPYPNNLQIRCHRSLYPSFASAIAIYEWASQDYGLPCRILDRWIDPNIIVSSLHMALYTVQIEYVPTYAVAEQHYSSDRQHDNPNPAMWIARSDVPRSAIRFFDKPHTTDLHQPFAFRHYIQIPDDIFPPQWKNLQ